MSGSGTLLDPYDFTTALSWHTNLKPGDTLWLRGGTYDGAALSASIQGLSGRAITIRPETNEHVIIEGSLSIPGKYLTLEGDYRLEVQDSTFTDRISTEPTSAPSDINGTGGSVNPTGTGVTIRHCLVHDLIQGLDGSAAADSQEFYGNLYFYNGWRSVENSYGHGVYNQNNGATQRKHRHNMAFDNFGYGFHLYGSTGQLHNILVEDNILFNNGSLWSNWFNNLLLGGATAFDSPVLRNNYTYYDQSIFNEALSWVGKNELGNGGAENVITNATVIDNYFYHLGNDNGFNAALIFRNLADADIVRFDGNTIIGRFYGNGVDLADWPDNVQLLTNPAINKVAVLPDEHNSSYAHLVIYNYEALANVTVSLAALGWTSGTVLACNAQDFLVDRQSLTITSESITVNMQAANRSVRQPIGTGIAAPGKTCAGSPAFGAFVLLRV